MSDLPQDSVPQYAIAIETSCRQGGIVLGRGGAIVDEVLFDASQRHATALVARLSEMLRRAGLAPADLREIYVSAGPGSFTGLRVGITVARTLAQAVLQLGKDARCVAVPTVEAVLEPLRDLGKTPWQNLGVVLDAGDGNVYAAIYTRDGQDIVAARPAAVLAAREFIDTAPRPITLVGEGLAFHKLQADGVALIANDSGLTFPTARSVYQVGCRLARAGVFTDYHHLLPIYSRKPLAQVVWEAKQS